MMMHGPLSEERSGAGWCEEALADLIARHIAPLHTALANLVAAEAASRDRFTAKEIDTLEKAMSEATAALSLPNTTVSHG